MNQKTESRQIIDVRRVQSIDTVHEKNAPWPHLRLSPMGCIFALEIFQAFFPPRNRPKNDKMLLKIICYMAEPHFKIGIKPLFKRV